MRRFFLPQCGRETRTPPSKRKLHSPPPDGPKKFPRNTSPKYKTIPSPIKTLALLALTSLTHTNEHQIIKNSIKLYSTSNHFSLIPSLYTLSIKQLANIHSQSAKPAGQADRQATPLTICTDQNKKQLSLNTSTPKKRLNNSISNLVSYFDTMANSSKKHISSNTNNSSSRSHRSSTSTRSSSGVVVVGDLNDVVILYFLTHPNQSD